jgi:two-component system phosphate regulon sensor histidine kinase PhoR
MEPNSNVYRKNFTLIIVFFVLISITLVIALIIAYNLTKKYVEGEFSSRKIDVLEATVKPYNDFFLNKIPEITSYQGYLNFTSAADYSGSVFKVYPFVSKVDFYEIAISGKAGNNKPGDNLAIKVNSVYRYHFHNGVVIGSKVKSAADATDFSLMAGKLYDYITFSDTSRGSTQDEIFKTFYDVKPDKISFMNILRREDVIIYRQLQNKPQPGAAYQQNMMTFLLDPYSLKVKNLHRELYQSITIKPVVYYPLDDDPTNITTEVALPGAFSDYKLYFKSGAGYLTAEIDRRFMPIAAAVLLLYFFLFFVGYLIYRNLKINMRLYKLQYDFINNFTHEFKTPVSVIKIAGSNLRNEGGLSERQLKHYGKILDEEADKLNELMNKLLSFTQLENKSIRLKKEEVDLKEFVKSYTDSFSIKYPDLKLDVKITDAPAIYTDPVLLGSIFQNLMENACKYSHPQKKELKITITGDKRNIIFSFKDRGIGIPKNELNNIFNKFYRIENQYNQNGSVGLGLAFCKELVNFMSGEIAVNSIENEGSEFIVTLPNDN